MINNIRNSIRPITKIKKDDIIKALFFVFVFFVVFTPVDITQIKKISFLFLLIISLRYIRVFPRGSFSFISLFGFWLTGLSIITSIILTNDIINNILQGYMGLYLLLLFLIDAKKIDFKKIFTSVLLLLVVFIVVNALFDLIGLIPMYSNSILMGMHKTENALVGKNAKLVTGYMIFIKTSPLLVLVIPSLYKERKHFALVLTLLAIVISGTRANILVGIVVLLLTMILNNDKTIIEKFFLLLVFTLVFYFLINGFVINTIKAMFSLKSEDDLIRKQVLYSILVVFRDNPISLLFGSGYASGFYDYSRQTYFNIVELSYWNLLRQVGIIVFIPMMACYFYPAIHLLKKRETSSFSFAFIGYLLIAYTNPLLFSTTGLLGLLYMYYIALCYEKNTNLVK